MGSKLTKYTFSKFIYFDTNIVSTLAKDRSHWTRLAGFLEANDLTIGFSSAQVAELSAASALHEPLVALLISHPSGVLKTWETIISEEVEAHPDLRSDPLLMYPINAILLEEGGLDRFNAFLSSKELQEARDDQLNHAKLMEDRLLSLKSNFPPASNGKYNRDQAEEFVDFLVMQWLSYDHRSFLKGMQLDILKFHPEIFKSIRLYAYVIYYKYYLGQRTPRKLSDFGDLAHIFYIPYCEIAVMERDLCNVLNQIKKNHPELDDTIIRNIDFLKVWNV